MAESPDAESSLEDIRHQLNVNKGLAALENVRDQIRFRQSTPATPPEVETPKGQARQMPGARPAPTHEDIDKM